MVQLYQWSDRCMFNVLLIAPSWEKVQWRSVCIGDVLSGEKQQADEDICMEQITLNHPLLNDGNLIEIDNIKGSTHKQVDLKIFR